jgi:DNA polymerase I-like protein with 3'-5' exonuclease and polymerase domains
MTMQIPDCVSLEMQMANIMAIQEASGFRFDMEAAERVRGELAREAQDIEEKILAIYKYYPGKVFTPKRTSS